MKKNIFFGFLILVLFLSFNIQARDKRQDMAWRFFHKSRDCTPLHELNMTEEQHSIISQKRRFYREQTMSVNVSLLAKRLEFERMLKNPETKEDKLNDIAEEIGQLTGKRDVQQSKLLIDIHQILTPPQIEAWCPTLGKTPGKGKARRP